MYILFNFYVVNHGNLNNNVRNRNPTKPNISEEIKELVRRNFTREIEFYQFCRQRLHKQYLALKLKEKDYNSFR